MVDCLHQLWAQAGRKPVVLRQQDTLHGHQEDRDVAHEILPRLFLGDKFGATNPSLLAQHGVRALLMLCARDERDEKWWHMRRIETSYPEELLRHGVQVVKVAAEDKLWYPVIAMDLHDTIVFLDRCWLESSLVVYVHCQAGVSRSATLITAYLKYRFPPISAQEALSFVQKMRPRVDPNASYLRQLSEWESRTLSLKTVDDLAHALELWRSCPVVLALVETKRSLDALFTTHVKTLQQPGQEEWSSLKDIDALKHDIMDCMFPVRNLLELQEMLLTQAEDFPNEFCFLDADMQKKVLQLFRS